MSWEYDADGNRTGFTDTTGITTTYTRDAAGRVKTVRNSRLGEAGFTRDAAGRLTAVTAGDLVQEWVYRNGYLAEHTRTDRSDTAGSADITLIGRDGDGRITGLTRAGAVTRYGYDGAGQLVAAATTPLNESKAAATARAQVSEWEYDAGGRLVREYTPCGPRTYAYDTAGQLVTVAEADGSRTEYVYDGLGRRSRLIGTDGSWTEYAWGETGYLQGTVDRTPDGMETSRHELWVDALGELASVDGCSVWWDSASPIPTLAGIGDEQVLNLPGGVTGIGNAWIAPGWRAARPTDETDPWAVLGTPVIPEPGPVSGTGAVSAAGVSGVAAGLPSGISLTGNGGLDIAGLEWLGARAYDPAARGFLSTDPLAPVLGAGWDGNPYAYAGNNPLNATDPTGLQPLTDKDLKAYDAANQGALAAAVGAVGDFMTEHAYIVGAVMVVAGGIMMATGVGGPFGAALVGAGVDTIIQKATTGTVNWGQVAVNGAVGMVAGPLGGRIAAGLGNAGGGAVRSAVSQAATRAGNAVTNGVSHVSSRAGQYLSQLPADQMVKSAVSNGIAGGVTNTGMYYATEENPTVRGALGAGAGGVVSGAAGGQGGYLTNGLGQMPSKAIELTVGGGASLAGGAVGSAVEGENYGGAEMVFDSVTGGALTFVPSATDGTTNPGWSNHAVDGIVSAETGAIVEGTKQAIADKVVEAGGENPW